MADDPTLAVPDELMANQFQARLADCGEFVQDVVEAACAPRAGRVAVVDINGEVVARRGWEEEEAIRLVEAARQGRGPENVAFSVIEGFSGELGWVLAEGENASDLCESLARILADRMNAEIDLESVSLELSEKYEELNLLNAISESMSSGFDEKEICSQIISTVRELTGAMRVAVLTVVEGRGLLKTMAQSGFPDGVLDEIEIPTGAGVSGRVLSTGKSLLVDSEETMPADIVSSPAEEKFIRPPLLCVPLAGHQQRLGVVLAMEKTKGVFTSEDMLLLSGIASQAGTSIYNCRAVAKLREAERVQREMEIAREIQRSLLPESPPPIPGTELACLCIPADRVGGDYYDVTMRANGRLSLTVADVSGHNIGAGIMMAAFRSMLRAELLNDQSMASVFERINKLLFDDLARAELTLSAFGVEFDPETKVIRYANGGHCRPVVWREAERRCIEIDAEGLLIGVLEDIDFEEKQMAVDVGDVIVLYTDGVTEAASTEGVQFGEERLAEVVASLHEKSAEEICNGICQAVQDHISGRAQYDDITLMVFKRCG